MKALTLKQPWASLVVSGGKDIENRNWPTKVRGIVAIHSSARMEEREMGDACCFMESFIPCFSSQVFRLDTFPTGKILGLVEIVDCVEKSESPWFVGDFGFVLRYPVVFENPITCRGERGFWDVPDSLIPEMRAQYRRAADLKTPLIGSK